MMNIKLALSLNDEITVKPNDIVAVTTCMKAKSGLMTIEIPKGEYVGKIARVNNNEITVDCSKQFCSELVTIDFDAISNITIIDQYKEGKLYQITIKENNKE